MWQVLLTAHAERFSVSYMQDFFLLVSFSIFHQTSRTYNTKPPMTFIATEAAWSGGKVTGDKWLFSCLFSPSFFGATIHTRQEIQWHTRVFCLPFFSLFILFHQICYVQCSRFNVNCVMFSIQWLMFIGNFSIFNVQFSTLKVLYQRKVLWFREFPNHTINYLAVSSKLTIPIG